MATENKLAQQKKTNHYGKISPPLPKLEIFSCFAALIFACVYSLYKVYLCSQENVGKIREMEIVRVGSQTWWKDVSDTEFLAYGRLLKYYLVYLAAHFIGTNFIKRASKEHLPHMMSLIGAVFLIDVSGSPGLFYCLLQPLIFYFVMVATKSPQMIYLTSLSWIYGKQRLLDTQNHLFDYMASFYLEEYPWSLIIAFIASNWINSRCLSYCLDVLWGEVPKPRSHLRGLSELLSYCFYVPLLFFGPLVNYKEHHQGLKSTSMVPLTFDGLKPLIFSFVRPLFWLVVAEASLYFLYFHGLSELLDVMNTVDSWTLAGISYIMAQFFNFKYIAFYGIPRAFLASDGIEPPLKTKCVARIAIYSDMWRYFDNGLYRFMKKYYFSPLLHFLGSGGGLARFVGSVVTFSFVFLWHGLHMNVLIWSVCNFAGVTLEAVAYSIGSTKGYQNLEIRLLPNPAWRRRFRGLVATPLCMASVISQFYFFMGVDAANVVVKRICFSWPESLVYAFFMYCGHQVSVEMRNRDLLREMDKEEKKRK